LGSCNTLNKITDNKKCLMGECNHLPNQHKNIDLLLDKDNARLSRIVCSLSTDYKFRDLPDSDKAKRLINYGYTLDQVLKYLRDHNV